MMLAQTYVRGRQLGGLYLVDEASSADESTAQHSSTGQEEEIVNFHKLIPGRIYSHGPSSLRSVQQQLGHLVQAQEDEMGRALLSYYQQHEPNQVRFPGEISHDSLARACAAPSVGG
jgi:hypothetical protein